MAVNEVSAIKELRERTKAGVMDCKKALKEANGDLDKAYHILREKGLQIAAKKTDRVAKQGVVESYIHMGGKIGVLVEVNCETDFVARNEEFKKFVKDVCLQVAAASPAYVTKEEVPADELAHVTDKEKYFKEICLLEQPFIKDMAISIKDYMTQTIAKTGENVVIRRFTRYQLGA